MTDMSRVIVNSGHPAAKLSFSNERHISTDMLQHTRTKLEKREEKGDKSHLSRAVPLHTKAISMFTHDNKNTAIGLFIFSMST